MAVQRTLFLVLVGLSSLALSLPSSGQTRHKLHHGMNDYHLEHFFNTKSLEESDGLEYDLVTPWQTEEDGSYLSHHLGIEGLAKSRRRRETEDDAKLTSEMHYKMNAFGEEHHFRLKRNDQLLHPNFMIGIHDGEDFEAHTYANTDCFYHGDLKSHDDSDVALSNCDQQLMGYVRKRRDVYHIHPLPEYLQNHKHNPNSHSHLVYKVQEKKATGPAHDIFKHFDERQRRQASSTVDPPPANTIAPGFKECSEDTPPKGYDNSTLAVDYADTMALQSAGRRVDGSFGNNFVQASIFIDHTMVQKHNGDENFLIRYHLSMMNMISLIYQPERTMYTARVVLITLRILRTPQSGLFITQDSKALLEGFCRYQQSQNPKNPSPWRWNHAFLVTGYGLCFGRNTDCGELGRAPIEGVCLPDRECSVNREGGLNTAFVMAHELGHNLGMFHDGHPSEAASCPYQDGYLMSPSTGDAKRIWNFSPCSRAHLRRYLRSQDSACMDVGTGGPTINNNLKPSCNLPGKDYSADQQCALQFKHWANRYFTGHSFKFCSRTAYGRNDICSRLFCDDGNTRRGCFSTYTPAMDGTPCGFNKICYRFRCVDESTVKSDYCAPDPRGVVLMPPPAGSQPVPTQNSATTAPRPATVRPAQPIDGGWSFFSAYSSCSESCGPGVRFRTRSCTNPAPKNNGKDCEGNDRQYELCNLQDCPDGKSNSQRLCERARGSTSVYVPPTSSTPAADQCKLVCRTSGVTESLRAARDGTPCPTGYCFQGKCSIGCDGVVGSTKLLDKCGVCGGDDSTCRLFQGTIQPKVNGAGTYALALRGTGNAILRGSWQFSIQEVTRSPGTVLSLRDNNRVNGNFFYYLNGPGQSVTTGQTRFMVAGANATYSNQPDRVESLTIMQRINRPLVIEVKYSGGAVPTYSFSFMSPILEPEEKFYWRLVSDWSACAVTCGQGIQGRTYHCINSQTDGRANPELCTKAGKPVPVFVRACVNRPCSIVRTGSSISKVGECINCLRLVERDCIGYDKNGVSQILSPRDCKAERLATLQSCSIGNETCPSAAGDDQIRAMCSSLQASACQSNSDVRDILCPQRCEALANEQDSPSSASLLTSSRSCVLGLLSMLVLFLAAI